MRSLRSFFITFGISLIVFGIIAWIIWGRIGVNKDEGPDKPAISVNISEDDGHDTDEKENEEPGDSITALLCCYESTPGSPDIGRADAIVLVNIDKKTKKFSVCPIPSYIKVDLGTENAKNEVYIGDILKSDGSLFEKKLEALTGLEIDYHLYISFSEFVDIINEIGGIEYNVPTNMYYVNAEGEVLVNLKAGTSRLMGEEALQLVRYRSYAYSSNPNDDGDELRRQTQYDFLIALFKAFLKPEKMSSIDGILSNVLGLLQKDATNFTVTVFLEHKDMIMDFESYEHELIEYPTSSKLITLSNGEKLAVHTPDIDNAVEDVFSVFRND